MTTPSYMVNLSADELDEGWRELELAAAGGNLTDAQLVHALGVAFTTGEVADPDFMPL